MLFRGFVANSVSLILDFGGNLRAEDLTSPYTDTVTLTLNTAGTVSKTGGPSIIENTIGSIWLQSGTASSWHVYAHVVTSSGTITGTTGSWLALTSNRAWTVSNNSWATLDLRFSNNAGSTVYKTVQVYLEASNLI